MTLIHVQAPAEGVDLTKNYVDYNRSAGSSGSFTNAREVHARFDLDPGTYVIIPCAFKPGEEGEFLLRIFTEKSSKKAVYVSVVAVGCSATC
jgi:hypothetical protein